MKQWYDNLINKNKIVEKFNTPIVINYDNEYYDELENRFDMLIGFLSEEEEYNHLLSICKECKSSLLSSLNSYYSGDLINAQLSIDNLMSNLFKDKNDIAVSDINHSISFHDKEIFLVNNDKSLYSDDDLKVQFFRSRNSEKYCVFSREEMVHIPFDRRDLIQTNRFSIPGLPCLYLGTTSYCCWLETDTPPEHQFNVSGVILDNSQKILNLTINTSDIIYLLKEKICKKEYIGIVFKLWLLTLATSFKVEQKNRVFKSEYVLSQLIMMSCRNAGLQGIAYYSTKVSDGVFAPIICVNLALFAQYCNEKKYSKICQNFRITNSMNFSMFKQLLACAKYRNVVLNVDNTGRITNIGDFDRQISYKETEFYKFDKYVFGHIDTELKTIDLANLNR